MLLLNPAECRQLRARAHSLHPVVSIAQQGLTESVLKEIDTSLTAHELIKIRVYGDDRLLRQDYLKRICEVLDAAAVQHIGKLLVVYRPSPETAAEAKSAPRRPVRREPRRTKRSHQGDGRP